ncbi:hypothetical protein ETR_04556, partial [Erwinia tracheiphila PSU-1]
MRVYPICSIDKSALSAILAAQGKFICSSVRRANIAAGGINCFKRGFKDVAEFTFPDGNMTACTII